MRRRVNRAAVAVARKLTVALKGRWSVVDEPGQTLLTKLHKLATELGVATLKELGYAGKEDFRQKKLYILKTYP